MSAGRADTTHNARYREIAAVLRRHSLGFLGGLIGLDRLLPFRHRAAGASGAETNESPAHLRSALEELGPTFIKLGQVLSTRPDLLPPAYIDELIKLQDAAPPVPVDLIRDVVRRELGGEPEDLFASFENEALASASIGQVHLATLKDGTPVVVKVRRPGAVAQVQQDVEIVQNLAMRASRTWELAREYDAAGLADEFAKTIRDELDYLQEGRNAERFAENFQDEPDVVIPRVFWEFTTSRVLTLERMHGANVSDATALDTAGVDRKEVASRGADMVLKMTFEDRFFHADLHPGNLFIHDDGTIALIDFGMVGVVEEELRDHLSNLFIALARSDHNLLASALVGVSVSAPYVDRDVLSEDLRVFLSHYRLRSLRETPFARVASEMFGILRDSHLRLPREMALLFKALLQIEGIAVKLDPDFRLAEALEPYAQRLTRERTSALVFARRLARASVDMGELALDVPGVLRRVIDQVDTTGLQVHLRAAELDPIVGRVERIGNRLVAGMIGAAFISGIGNVVSRERKWRSWEGAMVGTGLGVLSATGAYLAWTARRRGRRRP